MYINKHIPFSPEPFESKLQLADVAQWLSIHSGTKRSQVWIPVRAHVQLAGSIPKRVRAGGSNPWCFSLINVCMYLSLFLPISLSLKKKKIILKKRKQVVDTMLLYRDILQYITPKKKSFILHNLNTIIILKKFNNVMKLFNI